MNFDIIIIKINKFIIYDSLSLNHIVKFVYMLRHLFFYKYFCNVNYI